MIKCVIFDLDDLMIDSERAVRKMYVEVARELGFELDEEFFTGIIGSTKKAAQAQFDRFPLLQKNMASITKKRKEIVYNEIDNNPDFYKKGLFELLDYLDENNYKKCIGTSSHMHYVDKTISGMKKDYKFDGICTGEMVQNHKPEPDTFLLAAQLANAKPEECLVLEDSRNGLLAAKRAGMVVGFIYDTVEADEYMKSLYDYSFNSLDEVIDFLKK